MKAMNKFSPEVRERAVRMVEEHRGDYASEWAAMTSIVCKTGCTAEALAAVDRERLKLLERAVRELRQANEILRKASAYFAPSRRTQAFACRATGRSSTAARDDDRVHRRPP